MVMDNRSDFELCHGEYVAFQQYAGHLIQAGGPAGLDAPGLCQQLLPLGRGEEGDGHVLGHGGPLREAVGGHGEGEVRQGEDGPAHQQFKRSCMPDGPKVGSVALSPRGDWRMPSDASARLWLEELEGL